MRRPALPATVRQPLEELLAFSRFLARRFNDDQCFEAAGALSFTTVFAMVPLLTVMLSMFATFQEFSRFSDAITNFVFRHFVPTSGEEIQRFVTELVDKASHLTAVGIIALIISSLLLMTSIEHSFNRIWRLVSPRRALPQFIVFWTAMTLGPLLVGAGLAVSSAMLAIPYLASLSERFGLEAMAIGAMPFLVTFAAATLAYLIVPNCPVRLRHALSGGLFTATAFSLAKFGFALYVGQFASYQKIYGTVAFIPVFLLWIYVSWVVVLLGASLTAALGAYSHESKKRKLPERERFPAMLRLLGRLREAQVQGTGLSVGELAERLPDVPEATIAELMGMLERERIVQRTDIGSWILSRDPDVVRVRALYRGDAFLLPLSDGKHTSIAAADLDSRVDQICENAAQAAERQLDLALAELFRKSASRPVEPKGE
jgi:membrane protein